MINKTNIYKTVAMLAVWLLLLLVNTANAQLQVTPSNAANLVQNVLIGQGIQVSNIQFSGNAQQMGSFNGQNSNIGLPAGVFISTGRIGDAVGPNNDASVGDDLNGGGDADLESQIPGATTFDAATLIFDFVPQSSQLSFNYVFASEEYPEFVGSQYNDAFAFLISGPGLPPGGQNIAFIPGTTTPVAINNVNQTANSSFYVNNSPGNTVQFDGFTTPLSAKVTVQACQTYTIKIVIADVGDGIYDSGVFLQESSFSSNVLDVRSEVSFGTNDSLLYEGCGFADIIFSQSTGSASADTVQVTVTGNATNGADYNTFPSFVIFPPNATSVTVPITTILDNVPEGTETITITISQDICGQIVTKSITLDLIDVAPLQVTVTPNDTSVICPNQPVPLTAIASGGVPPLSYSWSSGGTGQTEFVFAQQTTTYTVTVTDACNTQTQQEQAIVRLNNYIPLTLTATNDTSICPGQSITLSAQGFGGRGDIVYVWNTGDSTQTITVSPGQSTVYGITITDSCGTTVAENVRVFIYPTFADFDYGYVDQRVIRFANLSSPDVISWNWDFGDGNTSTEINPTHTYQDTGWYKVTLIVFNEIGCTDTATQMVYAWPDYAFYVPNAFTPNADGTNEFYQGFGEGFVTYQMEIFNRWGELIYNTTDYRSPWLGRTRNQNTAPQGVYVAQFKLTTPPGDEYIYRSKVVLIN